MEVEPNKSEELFLNLAYKRFHILYDEIMNDQFWKKGDEYRFCKLTNIFSVYAKLSSYMPIGLLLEGEKLRGRSEETRVAGVMFRFLRCVLSKLPLFATWNEVWVSKTLLNWNSECSAIDGLLERLSGHKDVMYQYWDPGKKCLSGISMSFPKGYDENRIYLKELLSERDGVIFSVTMMWQILNNQLLPVGRRA